jgi:hypothetical protein
MPDQDMRVLEVTSDYNMAEDIEQPMGEVLETFAPNGDESSEGCDFEIPSH